MGVAGCGKSTVAARLARRLGWDFAEADTFHSQANIAKMSSGSPLTDDDRAPWLDAMAAYLGGARAAGRPCVLACSALRRVYRERLAAGNPDVRCVYLQGSYEMIAARLATRRGHYMPASLLASQFATLEEPTADEHAITLPAEGPVATTLDRIARELGLARPS